MSKKNKNAEQTITETHEMRVAAEAPETSATTTVDLTPDELQLLEQAKKRRDSRRAYNKTRQANLTPEQKQAKKDAAKARRERDAAILARGKELGLVE